MTTTYHTIHDSKGGPLIGRVAIIRAEGGGYYFEAIDKLGMPLERTIRYCDAVEAVYEAARADRQDYLTFNLA